MREYKAKFDIKIEPEDPVSVRIVETIVKENLEDAIGWASGVKQFLQKYYSDVVFVELEEDGHITTF